MDNIITDLHKWYQKPQCLPPIGSDTDKGKPSDHLTVVFKPINVINNIPLRRKRNITSRPITESGLNLFQLWIQEQTWDENKDTCSVNTKANLLHETLVTQVKLCFPEKTSKHTSDDAPWCNDKVKRLKRKKSREYNKHRRSQKWFDLEENYKLALNQAKRKYYKYIVDDLKQSHPSQWYSKLKRICSYDQEKHEEIICEEINHLTDSEQAEKILEHFAGPRNKYSELNPCDIQVPFFQENSVPQFPQKVVSDVLKELKLKKAVPPGDIPTVIF